MNTATQQAKSDARKLGKAIRFFRLLLEKKQEEVSKQVNLAQPQLSLIENGDRVIDNDLLERIAAALEVPVLLLKNFDADNLMRNFTNTNNQTTDSEGSINNQIADNVENKITINDPEHFRQLYKDIIDNQKQIITQKDKLIDDLQKQIENLKK